MALTQDRPRRWSATLKTLLFATLGFIASSWRAFAAMLKHHMPQGLYGRSLLIVIVPMFILQGVVAFVFMERHWQTVTQRLSAALASDIAALVDLYGDFPEAGAADKLSRIANDRLDLTVTFLPGTDLPPAAPKPFFSLLDRELSNEITRRVARPYWIDTIGRSSLIEIRIKLDNNVMRVVARRSQAYASNSHIFIVWMLATSLILIGIALLFLRNQIRPIQRLAEAAELFGKGREAPRFRIGGAREVRQAAHAFVDMRARIERQIEQRTTMLAGVSHDLRTILTRFRLQLALLGNTPELTDMARDVDEMQRMLEDYLAFARGDQGEQAVSCDVQALLHEVGESLDLNADALTITTSGDMNVVLRVGAFKRCVANLASNAAKFGTHVDIAAHRDQHMLTICMDDNGPGIPDEELEQVFRPFYRLDDARNQDQGGTGLGLAIARDIARSHGGDIELTRSNKGGLRACLIVPV